MYHTPKQPTRVVGTSGIFMFHGNACEAGSHIYQHDCDPDVGIIIAASKCICLDKMPTISEKACYRQTHIKKVNVTPASQ